MDYRNSRSGYNLKVESLFLARTAYVVQASVEYNPHVTDVERRLLSPTAQLELLLAIEGAVERGRRLGAEFVTIAVEGDEPLERLKRLRKPGEPSRVGRPLEFPTPDRSRASRRLALRGIVPLLAAALLLLGIALAGEPVRADHGGAGRANHPASVR